MSEIFITAQELFDFAISTIEHDFKDETDIVSNKSQKITDQVKRLVELVLKDNIWEETTESLNDIIYYSRRDIAKVCSRITWKITWTWKRYQDRTIEQELMDILKLRWKHYVYRFKIYFITIFKKYNYILQELI